MLRNRHLLFDKAGADGSAGGSGTGTLLGGGGGTGADAGNAGAGGGNNSGNAAAANQAANQSSDVRIPDNWKLALPKELQESESLKAITNLEALAKSYVNAQKLIGADKIPVPTKHATDEDWQNVFTKLGLPKELKEYTLTKPKDATFDDQFIGQLKEVAHKSGILPKQAQALVDWFAVANNKVAGEMQMVQAQAREKEIAGLQTEWGEAFKTKVAYANQVLKEFGGKELEAYLQKNNLANDTQLVRLLSKVGEKYYSEGKIMGEGTVSTMKTPDEAKKSIATVMGNSKHPYHDKQHPGHKSAVQEMESYFSMAYPKKSS